MDLARIDILSLDFGPLTCGGYPGSGGNLQLDMQVPERERKREELGGNCNLCCLLLSDICSLGS